MDEKQVDKNKEVTQEDFIAEFSEKASIGGAFNTSVTSHDPEEKDEIEKKGSLAVLKPKDGEERQEPGQ